MGPCSRHTAQEGNAFCIMLWGCFAAGRTGALHKIDGFMRKGRKICRYIEATSQDVRKAKLGHKWVFQMDNDPKHTPNIVAKWLKDNKVKMLEWLL